MPVPALTNRQQKKPPEEQLRSNGGEKKGSDNISKVYVVTSANPMEAERYETVKASFKEAEKYIRKSFPNARKDEPFGNVTSFLCKERGRDLLMFIHEETIV